MLNISSYRGNNIIVVIKKMKDNKYWREKNKKNPGTTD